MTTIREVRKRDRRAVALNEVPIEAAERLNSKLAYSNNGCLVWGGARDELGYGRISVNGALYFAHRIAWILSNGPIPDGLWVLHRCDNPPCCRIGHLFLGTAADNSADMFRKRRASPVRGEDQPISKLTEASVALIRAETGRSHASFARQFGVTESTIRSARLGFTWKHVGVSS